ncbi:LOW QUALITY PROTEIN: growth hormone-regulated TBC protein 1-A-like [Sycon ciliatum]|uniref:LOW QUALITY PROTEIN: growth hormone-regulated TBC protein 1-A-like n=1 Tax=Sycon ciliatum TaxID=27933 RepID=UPI0031F6F151
MSEAEARSPESAKERLQERLSSRSEAEASNNEELAANEETLDPYGFVRGDRFDHAEYDTFNAAYTTVLVRRTRRWTSVNYNARHRRLKRYIRKGVPSSMRREVWLSVSGASDLLAESPGLYDELKDISKLEEKHSRPIELDIHRTLTDNVYFRLDGDKSKLKLDSLRNVLVAIAKHRPSIGYCQGLNFVTAYLLLIVENEEEVWLMIALLDSLPDYYGDKLRGMQMDCYVLQQLVKMKMPRLHDHFLRHSCSVDLFATKWFINLFLDCLPQETAFRVLDCLFYEGSKVLFRVALTILKHEEERLLSFSDIGDLLMFMKVHGIVQCRSTVLLKGMHSPECSEGYHAMMPGVS